MKPVIAFAAAAAAAIGGASGALGAGWGPLPTALAAAAAGAGVWGLLGRLVPAKPTQTTMLAASPELLERRRAEMSEELGRLEEVQELQRGVFEVSAELVGCVEEADARTRFAAAMRRYWSCAACDLMVWERGRWRSLGGEAAGAPPELVVPVALPGEGGPHLVLDLSPGVDGQGALVLRDAKPQPSLVGKDPEAQRYIADVLRSQLALSLRRVMLFGELQSLARNDPLTGTHRRWYGETRLKELVDSGEVLSVAMVDIDLFKEVNNQLGHAAGDQVLAGVGRCLVSWLRSGDLVCRFGGEEFLVLLPETPPQGALLVAERLRAGVMALDNMPMPRTVSIGVASALQDETPEALLQRADEALYKAKAEGRNRVVVSEEYPDGSFLRTTSRKARTTTALVKKLS
jgi:diguanylate cyclase (GGDEF)-like protein